MNSRYLEAIAVGILTALIAGFAGIGAQRTQLGSAAPTAVAMPMVAAER
jgi:hypothetical protein